MAGLVVDSGAMLEQAIQAAARATITNLAVAALLLFAPGCGTHQQPAALVVSGTHQQPAALVVIGNSITLHGPNPEIGWYGNWGMAASAAEKDYAHLSAAALGGVLVIPDHADFERSPDSSIAAIPAAVAGVTPESLVVVQLGDNVADASGFRRAYGQLLDAISHRAGSLICLSTWWRNAELDGMIEVECSAHGGAYVFIGDIYSDPANPDQQAPLYWHGGVNAHPHDWGMARIAGRVVAAVH